MKVVSEIKRRNTRQRTLVLEVLKAAKTHPTALEIYELAKKIMPSISLGTVYRNLEILVKEGVVRCLEFEGEPKRFDGTTTPHAHVKCRICGMVDDVDLPILNDIPNIVRQKVGFLGVDVLVSVWGICPKCLSLTKTPEGEKGDVLCSSKVRRQKRTCSPRSRESRRQGIGIHISQAKRERKAISR